MFRYGVSKQRALPGSSRVILSYYSLQMIGLCTKHGFMLLQSQGSTRVCRKANHEGTARYEEWENCSKVACHSIFNVLPQTSSDFITYIFTLAVSDPVTLSHWCSTDFHQMGEVYTTRNSVSRKRSWYITDTTNWFYNEYRVFPGYKADGRGVDHPHLSNAEVTKVVTPLLPLWAFVACSRLNFTFFYFY
jgi:hypothetical protein